VAGSAAATALSPRLHTVPTSVTSPPSSVQAVSSSLPVMSGS
jgi:hypothetical protein